MWRWSAGLQAGGAAHRTGRRISRWSWQTGAIVEITLVQMERAIGLEVDQVVEDRLRITSARRRGQPITLYSPELTLNREPNR